jgi:hypothetical protein
MKSEIKDNTSNQNLNIEFHSKQINSVESDGNRILKYSDNDPEINYNSQSKKNTRKKSKIKDREKDLDANSTRSKGNERYNKFKNSYLDKIKLPNPSRKESFMNYPRDYHLEKNPFVYSNILDVITSNKEPSEHEEVKEPKKSSSINTIFSVWCCMIGSGVINLPWAIKQAGIIPTLFLTPIYGAICFYTCYIYLKTGINAKDFSDTVSKYFGKKYGFYGRSLQIIASILLMVGINFIFVLLIR